MSNPMTSSESFPKGLTAAQIPLQTFSIPTLPDSLIESLLSLTLTSDIKPVEYGDLLNNATGAEEICPVLPKYLEALTLELFALGWPRGWLRRLAEKIPAGEQGGKRLRQLTIYSCLLDGVDGAIASATDENNEPIQIGGITTRQDAATFLHDALTSGLSQLHFIDCFCQKGFLLGVGNAISQHFHQPSEQQDQNTIPPHTPSLLFLEVSYTNRGHSDRSFLSKIPGRDLHALIQQSCIGVSLSLEAPPSSSEKENENEDDLADDPADVDHETGKRLTGKKPEGIIPLAVGEARNVVARLTGLSIEAENGATEKALIVPKPSLRMLDLTLYTLTSAELKHVVTAQPDLRMLSVCVELDLNNDESDGSRYQSEHLLKSLTKAVPDLEILSLTLIPGKGGEDDWQSHLETASASGADNAKPNQSLYPDESGLASLKKIGLTKLSEVTIGVLKIPRLEKGWEFREGAWKQKP